MNALLEKQPLNEEMREQESPYQCDYLFYYKDRDGETYLLVSKLIFDWLNGVNQDTDRAVLLKHIEYSFYRKHRNMAFHEYLFVIEKCGFFANPTDFDIRLLLTPAYGSLEQLFEVLYAKQLFVKGIRERQI